MPFWSNTSCTCAWFHCEIAVFSSRSALTKFVPFAQLADLSSSGYKMPQCIHEGVSIQRRCHLDVNSSQCKTSKYDTIPFHCTPPAPHFEGSKIVNSHKSEWRFIRFESFCVQVCHLLVNWSGVKSSADGALGQNSHNSSAYSCHPIFLPELGQHVVAAAVSYFLMYISLQQGKNMKVFYQNDRMLRLQRQCCFTEPSSHTQDSILQPWTQLVQLRTFLDILSLFQTQELL